MRKGDYDGLRLACIAAIFFLALVVGAPHVVGQLLLLVVLLVLTVLMAIFLAGKQR